MFVLKANMAASMALDFGNARHEFIQSIRSYSGLSQPKSVDVFKQYDGSESEKKPAMDQALRDYVKELITEDKGCEQYKVAISQAIELASQDCCSASIPFLLLSDVFDLITLNQCEDVFNLVEDKLPVWKSENFYDAGKNYLLRMCNDLLRRLSKSQNTVFCGRIQLFLSRLFPLSEKSALNLMSQFNLENFTTYTMKSDEFKLKPKEIKDDILMEVEEGEMEDFSSGSVPVDYNLYRRFWALQDYFRKPTQCFEKIPWKVFVQNSDVVLNAFASSKLDDVKSSRKKSQMPRPSGASTFFAKYLTSEKLLDLQLNDSIFRRYVLVQFLILFQYLNAQVKFKNNSQVLSEEQSQWVKVTHDRIYQLIKETPPDGDQFAKTVEHILAREEHWNSWKNESCPSFERDNSDQTKLKTKAKRRWVGDDLQAHGGKIIKMGSAELTRLWNINPNNMEACQSEKRVFLPTLEDFFADAMEQADPEAQIEDEYKSVNNQVFQWKSLRLLARRSPHFFSQTNTYTPAIPLPQYLDLMLNKIAKEIPQTLSNEEMKTEVGEEEDIKDGQYDDELKQNDDQGEGREGNVEDLLQKEQLKLAAEKLGSDWKKLATELNFPEDDVAYFESENDNETDRALKMLTIWQENEGERATVGTLKIALKEVGLAEVIDSVFEAS